MLDNTYLTRASRSYVVDAASRHGAAARCVWLDTPLAQAQVNLVERLLDALRLAAGARGAARAARGGSRACSRRPRRCAPLRELEPPSIDEGFADVEQARRSRARRAERTRDGRVRRGRRRLRAERLERRERDAPHLVFDWRPDGSVDALAAEVDASPREVSGAGRGALCPHPGGPPTCWCRPPLPGLSLAFARAHGVDLARSILVGTSPAHRTLATTLGARYVPA